MRPKCSTESYVIVWYCLLSLQLTGNACPLCSMKNWAGWLVGACWMEQKSTVVGTDAFGRIFFPLLPIALLAILDEARVLRWFPRFRLVGATGCGANTGAWIVWICCGWSASACPEFIINVPRSLRFEMSTIWPFGCWITWPITVCVAGASWISIFAGTCCGFCSTKIVDDWE